MKERRLIPTNLTEAIELRRSRRKYIESPIGAEVAEKLQTLALEYGQKANVRLELVLNNGSAWGGLRKSYGMFTGVKNYVGLIASKTDFEAMERLGYYGELLMLHAVAMGLGTCWVGGSFDRKLCPFVLCGDEMIVCAIALGYAQEQESMKEKLIRSVTHRKTKTIKDMMTTDAPAPGWFMAGMRAVQKAPSAVNRQPVVFSLKEGKVTAGVEKASDIGSVLDLGIAKQHFELGAGCGSWSFGNHAEFAK